MSMNSLGLYDIRRFITIMLIKLKKKAFKMEEDQREVFYKSKEELEEILKNTKLNPEIKKLVKTAMEFAYSAAYCVRTCDMNGSYIGIMKYMEKYEQIKKLLENSG